MNELTVVMGAITLFALTMISYLGQERERAAWRAERQTLLDRIMARDYTEFHYTQAAPQAPPQQLVTDGLEAEWATKHGWKGEGDPREFVPPASPVE